MSTIKINQLPDSTQLDSNDFIMVYNAESLADAYTYKTRLSNVLALGNTISVNGKSGNTITLIADDISDGTSTKKFVVQSEKDKIAFLRNNLGGDVFLAGDGTYKTISGSGGGDGPNLEIFIAYTGSTAPATFLSKTAFQTYSGVTSTGINAKLNTSTFLSFTGTNATAISNRLLISAFNIYSGATATAIGNRLLTSSFNSYSGATGSRISLLESTLIKVVTGNSYTISNSDKNYLILFSNAGSQVLVYLPSLSANINFSAAKTGNAIVRFSGTTATLNTSNNIKTINTTNCAVSLAYNQTTNNWFAFGALGSGTTSGGGGLTGSFVSASTFTFYTGTTAPATYLSKVAFNSYSGTTNTAISNRLLISNFNTYSGTTVPARYPTKTVIQLYTGTTAPATYQTRSGFGTYTGSTNTRFNVIETNYVTGATSGLGLVKSGRNLGLAKNGAINFLSGTTVRMVQAGTNGALTGTTTIIDGFISDSDIIAAITSRRFGGFNNYTVTITPASSKVMRQGQKYKSGAYLFEAILDNTVYRSGGGSQPVLEITDDNYIFPAEGHYIINNNSTRAMLLLPSGNTAYQGYTLRVIGKGSQGWRVTQNANDRIHGLTSSTFGATGYIQSGTQYANAEIELIANTATGNTWTVISSNNTITIN